MARRRKGFPRPLTPGQRLAQQFGAGIGSGPYSGSAPQDVPAWPQLPGQRAADQWYGTSWRDRTPGGGGQQGGGGGGQAPLGPPPGTYDPQLDASLRASERGLRDFIFDTRRTGGRSLEDYELAREDATINRGRGREDLATAISRGADDYRLGKYDIESEYGRSMEDVTRNRDRGMADIGTARGDVRGDFDRQLAVLNRQYGNLALGQAQNIRQSGTALGGAGEQARAKRADNLAFDKAPLDTSLGRALRDLDLSQSRLGEDFTTSTGRLGENKYRAMYGLGQNATRLGEDLSRSGSRMEQDFTRLLGTETGTAPGTHGQAPGAQSVFGQGADGLLYRDYYRGVEDRAEAERRARRENREFGQDIAGSKYYQARYGAGTLPIWRPRQGGPRRRDPYLPPRSLF
jgi:hypothetical protein